MAGFSSVDDLIVSLSGGKSYRSDFNKTLSSLGTGAAGRWYDLNYFPGTPPNDIPGNLVRNWDFQGSSTGWTLSGGITHTIATHLLTKAGAGNDTATIPVECTPGLTYQVYCTFGTLTGSGNMTYTLGGNAGANITTAGTTIQDIVMGTSNANLVISIPSGITATTIDTVVVIKKLQFVPYSDSGRDGSGLWHGGIVSPETKHLVNMGAWTQVAAGNGVLMLCDFLGCYPAIDTKVNTLQDFSTAALEMISNGTFTGNATNWTLGAGWAYSSNNVARSASAATNMTQMMPTTPYCPYVVVYTISGYSAGTCTVSLGGTAGTTRSADGTYTETIIPVNSTAGLVFTPNAAGAFVVDTVSVKPSIPRYTDGAGVRMFLEMSKTDNGTGTPSMTIIYTNSGGTGTRNISGSPAVTATGIQSHIYHTGVAALNIGPFLPLQAGDAGIQSVQSIQMGAASGSQGYSTLWLVRPLATLPIMTAFVASERDFLNQLPSLPRVYDGARLGFIFFASGVVTNLCAYQGYADFAWS